MNLTTINTRIRSDVVAFMTECDAQYEGQIAETADKIAANLENSHLAFLAGPSASGKTTTAKMLELALRKRGIGTHVISMDSYFLPENQTKHLRNEVGDRDYESPYCLDLPLLREHYRSLSQGEEVLVPYFDFKMSRRNPDKEKALQLVRDEIAIYEGIHALNPNLYEQCVAKSFKLYISTQTDMMYDGQVLLDHTLLRLIRRVVRDNHFRGTGIAETLHMWDGVRRGELRYISPYKGLADYQFDTALGYEVAALKPFALSLFEDWEAEDILRKSDYDKVLAALPMFEGIDENVVAKSSLLREFIGGGDLKY
ncbi:MAG: nucleoside kinase [Oscillospiraceae bacterium]|nr:nucleoside kinase [Oscillospiraceae bacterium]